MAPRILQKISSVSLAEKIMRAVTDNDAAALHSLISDPATLPDFADENGISPLMAAAMAGHSSLVELLARHPLVMLDRQDLKGRTALHHAAENGHSAAIDILLTHKARFDIKTRKEGRTAYELTRSEDDRRAFFRHKAFLRWKKSHLPEDSALFKPSAKGFLKFNTPAGGTPALDIDKTCAALCPALEKMSRHEFLLHRAKILHYTKGHFPWRAIFLGAAASGRADIMDIIDRRELFEPETLHEALHAALRSGDHDRACLWLLRRGADPDVRRVSDIKAERVPAYETAWNLRREKCFDIIATWHEKISSRFIKEKEDAPGLTDPAPLTRALCVQKTRQRLHKQKTEALRHEFNHAVAQTDGTSIILIKALYAGRRRKSFLKDGVVFSKSEKGAALIHAFLAGEFSFARALIADGCALAHAPAFLIKKFNAAPRETQEMAKRLLTSPDERLPADLPGRKKRAEKKLRSSVPWIPRHYF